MEKHQSAILVLHYNKQRQTRECLDSILAAGYAGEQVFCYDNGSRPDVFESLQSDYPAVCHRRSEQNHGYSGGFNRACRWVFSSGFDSLLFLTNDTRIFPDTLGQLLRTASALASGFVAPVIYYQNQPDSIDSAGAYFDSTQGSLHHSKEVLDSGLLDGPWDYIPGTAMWLDRSVFETLGGMDESFHTYWEDVDFSFRARRMGIPLVLSEASRILHGVGKTCHKKAQYTTYYYQRNRIRFCRRYLSGDQLTRVLDTIGIQLKESRERLVEKNDRTRIEFIDRVLTELRA